MDIPADFRSRTSLDEDAARHPASLLEHQECSALHAREDVFPVGAVPVDEKSLDPIRKRNQPGDGIGLRRIRDPYDHK